MCKDTEIQYHLHVGPRGFRRTQAACTDARLSASVVRTSFPQVMRSAVFCSGSPEELVSFVFSSLPLLFPILSFLSFSSFILPPSQVRIEPKVIELKKKIMASGWISGRSVSRKR